MRGKMKYTILVTKRCNLACEYCYIGKNSSVMSLATAEKIIDFIYTNTPEEEKMDIGFFGGEPLLEFELIREITKIIEQHPAYDTDRIELSIVSNGTIFSDEIAEFIKTHNVGFVISCDGPANIQNLYRRFPTGNSSSELVEKNIRKAINALSLIPVNAVYTPKSIQFLPQTVKYLSALGVRQIYLNPDFSADWKKEDIDKLPKVYDEIAKLYIENYLRNDPHYISLFDSKITVILRGGYEALERCRMGKGEFAFAPNGNIYPCERLIGENEEQHCIGNIYSGLNSTRLLCHINNKGELNNECLKCSLKNYCMNWCGCSNFFSTGYYNRVSAFMCASEKAAILVSQKIYEELDSKIKGVFYDHLGGIPIANSNLVRKEVENNSYQLACTF